MVKTLTEVSTQRHSLALRGAPLIGGTGDEAQIDAAFAKAAHVTKIDIVNNRLIPNAMEPRAAVGEFDQATGEYTLFTTRQNPHVIRLLMGASVLSIPEHNLRVVAPDVGGGLGSKNHPHKLGKAT